MELLECSNQISNQTIQIQSNNELKFIGGIECKDCIHISYSDKSIVVSLILFYLNPKI